MTKPVQVTPVQRAVLQDMAKGWRLDSLTIKATSGWLSADNEQQRRVGYQTLVSLFDRGLITEGRRSRWLFRRWVLTPKGRRIGKQAL